MLTFVAGLGFRKRTPHIGARPGTLVVHESSPPTVVKTMSYNREALVEHDVEDASELRRAHGTDKVTWVNLEGFGSEELLREVAEVFGLHPLALEDVINVPQRPKCDVYGDQIVIIVRMVDVRSDDVTIEQVGIVLGPNYVLTFQERRGDVLDPVRERIRLDSSRLRSSNADYLAYAILDTIVDAYYPVLEVMGERLETLETEALDNPTPTVLKQLNVCRHTLLHLRRAAWPQREAIHDLLHDEARLSESVRIFLRDTHDHAIQAADVLEMYREMAAGLLNTYLSSIANRANEVMKTLTIMASIFIPLTFVAGIYGMNFDNMPELHYRWSYYIVWGVMITIVTSMMLYYRRLGWLGAK